MKFYMKALKNSKVLVMDIARLVISFVLISLNAMVLVWISDVFNNIDDPFKPMLYIALECVVAIVLEAVVTWLSFYSQHEMYRELLMSFLGKITNADYDMFVKHSTGTIVSVGHGSLKSLTRLPGEIMDFLVNALKFIITATAMILLNKSLAIPVIIIFGVVGLFIAKFNKKWAELDKIVDNLRIRKVSMLEETTSGFAEFRSFKGANKRQYNDIKDNNDLTADTLNKRTRYNEALTAICLSSDTAIMFVTMFASLYLMRQGSLASATAVVMVNYAWRLIDPLNACISLLSNISMDASPMPKYNEIMSYENKVSKGHLEFKGLEDTIEFDNVGFAYNDSHNVLDKTSFTIKKGQHIGICGLSGGGKTTLLKLIPKFYDVTSGSIKFDGVDIKNYTQDSIRATMGIVHQDPFIFDTTIEENLRFAREDRNVSYYEMREACKRAGIYEFIMSLPNKFETNVGPKGLKLSGGQKQRIALARLFIANPEIVILDEATSALDTETEQAIQRAIESMDCTVIVVAHRLSTIKKSDKIIVIDNHHVAEEGTHNDLMRKGGLYAHMVELAEKEDDDE